MAVETTKGFMLDGNRYQFDRGACSHRKGWSQLDCDQDAWYHGTWAHPNEFKIVAYLEGDVHVTTCDTAEEFVARVRGWFDFQAELGYDPRLDPMGASQRDAWLALGFVPYRGGLGLLKPPAAGEEA